MYYKILFFLDTSRDLSAPFHIQLLTARNFLIVIIRTLWTWLWRIHYFDIFCVINYYAPLLQNSICKLIFISLSLYYITYSIGVHFTVVLKFELLIFHFCGIRKFTDVWGSNANWICARADECSDETAVQPGKLGHAGVSFLDYFEISAWIYSASRGNGCG